MRSKQSLLRILAEELENGLRVENQLTLLPLFRAVRHFAEPFEHRILSKLHAR